jgi:hypothetical protein
MIDRKELANELILRESIRKAIKIVSNTRKIKISEGRRDEFKLREIINNVIKEAQAAVASVAKHDSTGINALEDLLKNTNVLSVLETGYKSLTTDQQQRMSYRNHILNAVQLTLAPENSRKKAGEDTEITEEVEIKITDDPTDDPDFIDVEEKEEVEVDEKEEFGLNGEDKTGRNRAFTDFHDIEKNILTAFDDLDNPEDITMFEEYLIKNLALYFDKFEGELAADVSEPAAAADAEPDDDQAIDLEDEPDLKTGLPTFELQEIVNLFDLDDIIKNIL